MPTCSVPAIVHQRTRVEPHGPGSRVHGLLWNAKGRDRALGLSTNMWTWSAENSARMTEPRKAAIDLATASHGRWLACSSGKSSSVTSGLLERL